MAKATEQIAFEKAFLKKLNGRLKGSPWGPASWLRCSWGVEIPGYGSENAAVALLSWGQDGSCRVVMSRTAVDGGERPPEEVPIQQNFKTDEEIVEAIWKAL